jgi:hypothetical protein
MEKKQQPTLCANCIIILHIHIMLDFKLKLCAAFALLYLAAYICIHTIYVEYVYACIRTNPSSNDVLSTL